MKSRTLDRNMRKLGAEPRGRVYPAAGAWGGAQLAAEVVARFKIPAGGGRATEPQWTERRLVPLAPRTLARLSSLARRVRHDRPGLSIEPMQLAGLLLEESTQRLNEKDIDRVLFETSTVVREAVLEGMRDLAAGRVISARDYVARRFGKKSKLEKKHG